MKTTTVLLVAVLCACLPSVAVAGQAEGQPPSVFRTVNVGEMVFRSIVDGKNLVVTIFAPTSGWIAVGFAPDSAMKGANFIIGYAEGGEAVLEDQFGVSSYRHKRDVDLGGTDNILAKSARSLASGTEIGFTIPLDSGDPYDKKLEPGRTYRIILAYGKTTDLDKRHAKKYTAELKL